MKRLLFVLLAITLMAGCASAAKGDPIVLTGKDAGKSIEVKVGDTIQVSLEGNPTTGYNWVMAPQDPAVLEQQGEAEFKAVDESLGASGLITETFKAMKKGQTTLRLEYKRPWEKDITPEKTFEVTVVVK